MLTLHSNIMNFLIHFLLLMQECFSLIFKNYSTYILYFQNRTSIYQAEIWEILLWVFLKFSFVFQKLNFEYISRSMFVPRLLLPIKRKESTLPFVISVEKPNQVSQHCSMSESSQKLVILVCRYN